MNDASRWRLELARDVATWYRGRPAMVLAGGSAARGQADAFSDLDLAVYWDRPDAVWLANPPLAAAGAERFKLHEDIPGEVYVEQYRVGAAKMDVVHIGLGWWERLVAGVVDRADIAPDKQELIDGFLSAVVIQGEPFYAGWRSRLLPYPEALAIRMVERHLFFYPSWVLRAHDVERGDWLSYFQRLTGAVRNLLGVLAGLNRRYVSTETPKRVSEIFKRMPIAPAHLADRVEALWSMDRAQVPEALGGLIAEVLCLVEQHLPQANVTNARRVFGFELRPCEARPAFRAAPGAD
jgi:hypothetical protein